MRGLSDFAMKVMKLMCLQGTYLSPTLFVCCRFLLTCTSSDGYSSGYSDGGGGQDAGDTLYEIVDSDVEDCDVDVAAASIDVEVRSRMGC